MKALLAAFALIFAVQAQAADIVVEKSGSLVKVDSVQTQVAAPWGETEVVVTSTFSNSCFVPQADELIRVAKYQGDDYGTLDLTLLNVTDRGCPANFAPVTVTISLGKFVRPNDGPFNQILVNGVVAP